MANIMQKKYCVILWCFQTIQYIAIAIYRDKKCSALVWTTQEARCLWRDHQGTKVASHLQALRKHAELGQCQPQQHLEGADCRRRCTLHSLENAMYEHHPNSTLSIFTLPLVPALVSLYLSHDFCPLEKEDFQSTRPWPAFGRRA